MAYRRRAPVLTPVDPPPADDDLADGVLDLKAAGRFVGHSATWVKEQIRAGVFSSFRVEKKRCVPRRELVRYLIRQRMENP